MNQTRRNHLKLLGAMCMLGATTACATNAAKNAANNAAGNAANAAQIPRIDLGGGVSIPILGYGTSGIVGAEGQKAIETALKLGYRHIDTAIVYGNEDIVGAAIKASGIPRSEIFITTKIMRDMHREGAARAFEESSRKLGTDYIDLYLLHSPRGEVEGAWETLTHLHLEGKIKAIGVSNFDATLIRELHQKAAVKPALNQIRINPLDQQRATRQAMSELGVVAQAYSPLGGRRNNLSVLELPELAAIAAAHQKTPAQIALRWLVQQNIVAIPKTSRPERMAENLAIFDFELTPQEMEKINGLDER